MVAGYHGMCLSVVASASALIGNARHYALGGALHPSQPPELVQPNKGLGRSSIQ
jgi:hypothetical protein